MSDGNSTTSHQSEITPTQTTPPPNPPPQPPPKTTSFPVRDDCWSDEATFTLIEAWGDKIVKYNSNSLRQIHWLEVSDAVNGRHGHVKKGRRTDVQCKNRIDTLKKKYKVEKAKTELALNNNTTYVSNWKFFQPLDLLIGSSFKSSAKTPTPRIHRRKRIDDTPPELPELPPPSSVPVGRRSKRPPPPAYRPLSDGSFFRRNFSVMAAAAAAEDEDEEDSDVSLSSSENLNRNRRKRDGGGRFVVEEETCRELAEAIVRFAEVYERVEEAKQRQIVELEKQRMQFTKDLEIERMKVFMESQVQLGKLKRLKGDSVAGKERMNEKLNEIPQSEQSYLSNGQVILHRSFYKIKSL